MHAVWPIVVALLTGPSGDRPAVSPASHVRAADNARALLGDAAARSATVRELIERLEASDVIVYVEITASPHIPLARTKLVVATAGARFLRIGLRSTLSPFDVLPLIAHELQHAVEIADRPDVRDDNAMRRLFTAIGHRSGHDGFETDEARRIELQARKELGSGIRGSRIPHP